MLKFERFVVILLLILAGCATPKETRGENPIVYGLTLEPSGFDPHIHRSAELGIVLRQVYDTLVYRHPETREIVPGLATSWEISDDRLSYTFQLRQDVTFHDGTPFNAQAVAANLDRIVSPDTRSQKAAFMLGPYIGYEIVDTYTIRILLSEPFSPLLDSLSQVYLGIASPTALAQYSPERYQFHQVGTGPFRFIKYTPGVEIVLQRNENYAWGPEFYEPLGDGAIDEIIFKFYEDPPTRTLALENGDAHIMGEIPPASARLISSGDSLVLQPVSVPGQPLQFMFNTEQYPTNDVNVRRALLYATNRGVIVDTVFQGFSPIAWGPLSSNTLYYNPEVEGMYAYDPDQARALLATAGFIDTDNDGLLNDGEANLQIIMLIPPWGQLPEVAQVIQSQWREIGVDLQLTQVSGFTALREAVAEGQYHLVSFDTPGYDPYFLNEFYMTNAANNYMNFSNTELDAALLTARQELSPSARRSQYAAIQRFIMEQALILPIREYVNLNAHLPSIHGLVYDPYGWFPLLNNVTIQ